MSEKSQQKAIVQLLETLGAKVYVLGTVRRRGDYPGTMQTPGLPDVMAFVPSRLGNARRQLLTIEVKAHGGRLRPAQVAYHNLAVEAGVWHVVGGVDAVIEVLQRRGYLVG